MLSQILGYWMGSMMVCLLIAEIIFGIGYLIEKTFRTFRK